MLCNQSKSKSLPFALWHASAIFRTILEQQKACVCSDCHTAGVWRLVGRKSLYAIETISTNQMMVCFLLGITGDADKSEQT